MTKSLSSEHATLIGFSAVLLWALLALFTVATAPVPAFQLNALCFAVGGAVGVVWLLMTGRASELRHVPIKIYAFGTIGLFGYHALYFSALRLAPPAEAGLIAYLWPLLIVLFSGLLPGERLTRLHILGALISFSGAALLLSPGEGGFQAANWLGYVLAALCALTWSSYSVLSRKIGAVPTSSVVVFCLATAALSAIAHVLFEDTAWPSAPLGWAAIFGLGLGPVGLAFYTWDVGVKRGNIQLLGTASYAAPVLSTLILVVTGFAAGSMALFGAAALIAGGAALASRSKP